MPNVFTPTATKLAARSMRQTSSNIESSGKIQWLPEKDHSTVFDEPLELIVPRAIVILVLWLAWSFAWSGATFVGLGDHYALTSGAPLGFWDYWYYGVMHITNVGANDINPTDLTGRIWLAVYALFTVAFLYALVSVL